LIRELAGTATTQTTRLNTYVAGIQRVAVLTVGLAGIERGRALAAQDVHRDGHRLEVVGIATGANPAEMIDRQLVGKIADEPHPDDSVDALVAVRAAADGHLPVAITIAAALPDPTARLGDLDVRQDAVTDGERRATTTGGVIEVV
jgi:hypothetical protein